jgi:hypothetical protein
MRRSSVSDRLGQRLHDINVKLERFGVPFALTRMGNYRNGEFEIQDVVSVFLHREFKISIVFQMRTPYTGEFIEYWAQFNSTYSTEALSGNIVIPVVNGDKFLMLKTQGPFIGKTPLIFPRGFIPRSDDDLTAQQVSLSILDRKIMEFVNAAGGSLVGSPRLLLSAKGPIALAEDQGTSGNLVSVSVVNITLDEERFAARGRKARHVKLVSQHDFFRLVRDGEIMDMHSLSAFVAYGADQNG